LLGNVTLGWFYNDGDESIFGLRRISYSNIVATSGQCIMPQLLFIGTPGLPSCSLHAWPRRCAVLRIDQAACAYCYAIGIPAVKIGEQKYPKPPLLLARRGPPSNTPMPRPTPRTTVTGSRQQLWGIVGIAPADAPIEGLISSSQITGCSSEALRQFDFVD